VASPGVAHPGSGGGFLAQQREVLREHHASRDDLTDALARLEVVRSPSQSEAESET